MHSDFRFYDQRNLRLFAIILQQANFAEMFVLRAKHVRLTQSKRILEFTSVTLEMFLLISAFERQ